jgi:NAD(P)-dependent dehydrogenase (short-subunit alcohol dehydrogenase family)
MPTPQAPIRSDFDASSTAAEVIRGHDLRGKTAIVTGGSAGIGLETTRALASAGARVIVPARDLDKARDAIGTLATIEPMELTDPSSVAAFADRFLKTGQPLDLLINNAGIMAARSPALHATSSRSSRRTTRPLRADGEVVAGAATGAGAADRLAVLRRPPIRAGRFDDWNFERKPEETESMGAQARRMMKTVEQGAATTVWAAVSRQLDALGGVYCENCNIAEPVPADSQEMGGVRPWAMDPALAERLWQLSEKITGLRIG